MALVTEAAAVRGLRAWLDAEGIDFFRRVKAEFGTVAATLPPRHELNPQAIVHPVHFREGVRVRNFLRKITWGLWEHDRYENSWARLVERAIAEEETDDTMTIPPEIEQKRQLFLRLIGEAADWKYWVSQQMGENDRDAEPTWHLDNCHAAIEEMRHLLGRAEAVLFDAGAGDGEVFVAPIVGAVGPKEPSSPADTARCRVYDWTTLSPGHPIVARWHPDDSESRGHTCTRVDNDGYFHMDLSRASNHKGARLHIYSATSGFDGEADGLLNRTVRVPDQPSAALSSIAEALPIEQPANCEPAPGEILSVEERDDT